MKKGRILWFGLLLACLFSPAAARAAAEPVNLLSLQEGALPLLVPPTYSGWNAEALLDDSSLTGWACEDGYTKNNVFVFELAETASLERFEFDNANVDDEGAGVKDLLVEVSATSAKAGFTPVLSATLANKSDHQSFAAQKNAPARWVRLTLVNNHGSVGWTELFAFRGFGVKPMPSTPPNISGTYESSYAKFHVRRQGTALTGCYEFDDGLLNGAIEGRVMKIMWQEAGGPSDWGPAVMVFTPDGKSFRGFYWGAGNEKGAPDGSWDGKKISSKIGGCPHWSGSVGGELKKRLAAEKRARLYGILFDFNSAVIRNESKPVLDEVRDLLGSEPTWVLTIEGHTDDVGGDAQNQTLSQQRADAVKSYLVNSGVDAARLKTAGYGESNPVAENTTELGRAQNRRVELVRN